MERVLNHEQAVELLNEAVEKLLEKYQGYLTGCENIDEDNEIISKEVIIESKSKTDFGFRVQLEGWVELDRRIDDENDSPNICAKFILIIPELNVSFGGGYENDYRFIRAEYDVEKGEWGEFDIGLW